MAVTTNIFDDAFGPIRDLYLVHFLNALRDARRGGRTVLSEVTELDQTGAVQKSGILNLPIRDDFIIDPSLSDAVVIVPSPPILEFPPIDTTFEKNLVGRIEPFSWDNLWIMAYPICDSALLMRIRLWYLDWFQSRIVRDPEGVMGVTHRLSGPHEYEGAHWFHLDMGSAPVGSIAALTRLLSRGNVDRVKFSQAPAFALDDRREVRRR